MSIIYDYNFHRSTSDSFFVWALDKNLSKLLHMRSINDNNLKSSLSTSDEHFNIIALLVFTTNTIRQASSNYKYLFITSLLCFDEQSLV